MDLIFKHLSTHVYLRTVCVVAQVLKKIAWFVVLAPSSSDQITLLNTTAADKKLAELPLYKDLLSSFLTKEVCHTPSQY